MRNHYELQPDEIQIWIKHYSDGDQLSSKMFSLLSTVEIQRANAFHFSNDLKRYVQAHALLRLILCEYTGIQPQDIDFEIGVHGKPHLASKRPVYFNLSHTKEIIAIAVSLEHKVGIDIEKQSDIADINSVAHQFMSQEEYREMSYLKTNLKKAYFYQCWVQKEALAKASGRGIGDHLRTFTVMDGFCFERAKTVSTCFEETPKTWWLKTFELIPDHLGSVCIESSDAQTYSIKLKYEEGQFSA